MTLLYTKCIVVDVVFPSISAVKLEWDIEGQSWDEKDCGVERVSVPREKLYVPDVQIAEFLDEVSSTKTPYVYLYNAGHVYDDKPIRVVSSCQLGIYTFPFDIQNCSLTFGADIHFGKIVLRWRPVFYVVNLLIPSCFLITVDLFSFILITLTLGYTVFLLITNDLLPITGETTPLINVFFSISLALMVSSLLETLFITNIQFKSSEYSAVPHWLSILVLSCCSRLYPSKGKDVILNDATNLSDNQSIYSVTLPVKPAPASGTVLDELRRLSRDLTAIRLQMDKCFQGTKAAQEWEMIGNVINRLLFGLYIVFIVTSFIIIMSIWI
uniref:Neurotransmitter-gated ion-channel ligand-binding domain-containing protein n=1 Tax=Neolamprologus brichardi TaxID=32507 RepID=A0A3Q4I384_NEOBR